MRPLVSLSWWRVNKCTRCSPVPLVVYVNLWPGNQLLPMYSLSMDVLPIGTLSPSHFDFRRLREARRHDEERHVVIIDVGGHRAMSHRAL